jgi:hypothetical protein
MAPAPDASLPGILRSAQSTVMSLFIPPVSLTTAISTMKFKETTIGSGNHAVKVSLAETPTHGSKSKSSTGISPFTVALRANLQALGIHASFFPTGELMSIIRNNYDVSTSVLEREGQDSADAVVSALVNPDLANIRATAFLTPTRKHVMADEDIPDRFGSGKDQLRYVQATATLDPQVIDSRIDIGPVTAHFVLGLPQSARALEPSVQEPDSGILLNTFNSLHKSIRSAVTPASRNHQRPLIDDPTKPNYTYAGDVSFFQSKDALENNVGMIDDLEVYSTTSIKEGTSLPLASLFSEIHRRCSYAICSYTIWHDAVGFNINISTIVFGIQEALIGVKMIHYVGNKKQVRSPTECYQIFLKIMVLLPSSKERVVEWGFKIHQLYLQSLSPECRAGLNEQGNSNSYVLPPDNSVVTFQDQTRELRKVRNLAQAVQDGLDNLSARMDDAVDKRMKNTPQSQQGRSSGQGRPTGGYVGQAYTPPSEETPQTPAEGDSRESLQQTITSTLRNYFASPNPSQGRNSDQANQNQRRNSDQSRARSFLSPAEATMQQYMRQRPASATGNGPGCQFAGRPDSDFPVCRETGTRSLYPFDFEGCYGCGGMHKFSVCDDKAKPEVIVKFRGEYGIHFPNGSYRRQYIRNQQSQDQSNPSPSKMPRQYVVKVVKAFATPITERPMPVKVNNRLPMVFFETEGSVELGGLADTCGSVTSGNEEFHLWFMKKYPASVHSIERWDKDNFSPLKLAGAITDPADYDSSKHGLLTTVVSYWTTYKEKDGSRVCIKVALGPDVSVNTLFGLPTLQAMDAVMDLNNKTIYCRAIQTTLPLEFYAPRCGLPASATPTAVAATTSSEPVQSSISEQRNLAMIREQRLRAGARQEQHKQELHNRIDSAFSNNHAKTANSAPDDDTMPALCPRTEHTSQDPFANVVSVQYRPAIPTTAVDDLSRHPAPEKSVAFAPTLSEDMDRISAVHNPDDKAKSVVFATTVGLSPPPESIEDMTRNPTDIMQLHNFAACPNKNTVQDFR